MCIWTCLYISWSTLLIQLKLTSACLISSIFSLDQREDEPTGDFGTARGTRAIPWCRALPRENWTCWMSQSCCAVLVVRWWLVLGWCLVAGFLLMILDEMKETWIISTGFWAICRPFCSVDGTIPSAVIFALQMGQMNPRTPFLHCLGGSNWTMVNQPLTSYQPSWTIVEPLQLSDHFSQSTIIHQTIL